MHQNNIDHTPVMPGEVLKYLDPKPGNTYLDVTAGYGGHAQAILERTNHAPAVLIDRDKNAVDYLTKELSGKQASIVNQDFLAACQELDRKRQKFDLILADLGVSSPHLNSASRGFSFQTEGPLDMRMDQTQALDAATIVNTYSEAELYKVIRQMGEEPRAKKIAKAIVRNRPLKNTQELANVVTEALGGRRSKIHPATRTFQALRIVVNNELEQLEQALPIWIDLLKPGGRIVVISFHSLEDRLVKQALAQAGGKRYDADLRLLTKRPVTATTNEIAFNPRARSAKLRAAVKINI